MESKRWDSIKYRLSGHSNFVRALAALQNDYLASDFFDMTVKIWNTTSGAYHSLTGYFIKIILIFLNKFIICNLNIKNKFKKI